MMTPHLVQEATGQSPRNGQDPFVFLVCQHGVEAALKSRWLGGNSPFRLAFSRPGLLTLKCDETGWESATVPTDWLIRLSGRALGTLRGGDARDLVGRALDLAGGGWDAVHVFPRDAGLPGQRGVEPGRNELSDEVARWVRDGLESAGLGVPVNVPCELGKRVLDIVLTEPDQWLVGHHVASQRHECWPGGVFPVTPPPEMISRAYLKMAESVAWSGLPIQAGDAIVEIGSAPGGACQRLLDLGLRVTGIDAAEMDPALLEHPRFEHWRAKAAGIRRKMYSKFRWLAADANVAPTYTLDVVEDIVQHKTNHFAGLILTLKLSSYDLAEQMPSYVQRVRNWGFGRVEVRQLATNRRECCLVAERRKPADG